jgi:hypothetical protein
MKRTRAVLRFCLLSTIALVLVLALPSSALAIDFTGSGDATVGPFALPGGTTTFVWSEVSSSTSHNFIVWLYSVDTGLAVDLLVNDLKVKSSGSVVVDPYGSDPLPAGNYILTVMAPGPWTMSLVPSGTSVDTVTSSIDLVTPDPATVGGTVSFSGHGIDSMAHDITAFEWRSSIDGVLSSAASFSTTSLSVGTHTIYFRARCSDNTWSPEVSAQLTVGAPPLPYAKLYTPVAPSKMSRLRAYTIYGYLKPRHTSGTYPVRVYGWRLNSAGTWTGYGYERARVVKYRTYSKYSIRGRIATKGRWRFRAFAPADSKHAATWSSGYDYVTVK